MLLEIEMIFYIIHMYSNVKLRIKSDIFMQKLMEKMFFFADLSAIFSLIHTKMEITTNSSYIVLN